MFLTDDYYIFGYVDRKFVIVDFETLGETFQDSNEANIEMFKNSTQKEQLEICDSFKEDCIYNNGDKEGWSAFHNDYYNKFFVLINLML